MIQFFLPITRANVAYQSGAARLPFYLTQKSLFFALILGCLFVGSCKKDTATSGTTNFFTTVLHNEYSGLRTAHAAWLTNSSGEVQAAAWIPAFDTVQLRVPIPAGSVEPFDLTILELNLVTGLITGTDSIFNLTTYQGIENNLLANLREETYLKTGTLNIKMQNMQSLESIIVPNAFVFQAPQAATNYEGSYYCTHSGQLWFRLKANGDPTWKYAYLNNVTGSNANITIEDANFLPNLFDPPPHLLTFPFLANWNYDIQAITDLDKLRFLPIGDIYRAPGGAMPLLDNTLIYEPPSADLTKEGYRLHISGKNAEYLYQIDRFYDTLPPSLPDIPFSLEQGSVLDERTASVRCVNNFDVLVFENSYTAPKLQLKWDAWVMPNINGQRTYRLPDLPDFVAQTFPLLSTYPYTERGARADTYDQIPTYRTVVEKVMKNEDPVWRARARYLSKAIEF